MKFKWHRIILGISLSFWLTSFCLIFWLLTEDFSDLRGGLSAMGFAGIVVFTYIALLSISVITAVCAEYLRKKSFKSVFKLFSTVLVTVGAFWLFLPFLIRYGFKLLCRMDLINYKYLRLVSRSAPPLYFIWIASIGIPLGILVWLIIDKKMEAKHIKTDSVITEGDANTI
jgi:hypothetical protein